MKEIIYKNGKKFLLTNREFKEAVVLWQNNNSYFCERLERMFGPFFDSAGTPEEELGREIFINPEDKYKRRYFTNGKEYFEILTGGELMEMKFNNEKEKESFIKTLLPQDDFYDKKLLLK